MIGGVPGDDGAGADAADAAADGTAPTGSGSMIRTVVAGPAARDAFPPSP
jgi:hypothetical protein